MGVHKSEFIVSMKSLQYGDESFSLPVEASGGASDDPGADLELSDVGGLPPEASPLLRRADAAIADHRGSCVPSQKGIGVV